MKILHIASGDLWAGAEVQLFNLAVELNKHTSLKLKVILLNSGMLEVKLREKGIDVEVFNENLVNALTITKLLTKAMQLFQPDVVHTHRLKENILGSIATKLGSSARCVRTVHGQGESTLSLWDIHKHTYRIADKFCGRWLQSRIIAVSMPLSQLLKHEFPADRVVTIENGVNFEELVSKSLEPLPVPLNSKLNSIKICIVCRLTPVKRLDIFLKIAREALDISSDGYDFYIFGDGPLWSDVANQIRDDGLTEGVHMMGFQENISSYLSQMDVLLITSDHEGLPMNLIESMALGIFVIAHGTGGITSILDGETYGVALENQDVGNFVREIQTFKEEKETLQELKVLSQIKVVAQYSATVCADKHIQLYMSLNKRSFLS